MSTAEELRQQEAQRTLQSISGFLEKWPASNPSQTASNIVHEAATWGGRGVSAAIVIGFAGIGNLLIPGVGGYVLGGLVGVPLGAGVGDLASRGIEALGGWIANQLGFDFTTTGTTPGGGTWSNTRHPDGTYNRTEQSGGITRETWTDSKGGFHYSTEGNGYRDRFDQDKTGNSHFNANDSKGGTHTIDSKDGQYTIIDSDGKGNSSVYTTDGKGNSSRLQTRSDGSSTETHKTKNEKTGVTTIVITETDKDGNTKTTTSAEDKDGKPVEPPPEPDDTRDNPDGTGSESPHFKPGDFGRPRPGHPEDVVITPGQASDDFNEGPYTTLRYALRTIVLVTNATKGTGWGDTSGDEEAPDMIRKLSEYMITRKADGEDFIHPKASTRLISRMVRAIHGFSS